MSTRSALAEILNLPALADLLAPLVAERLKATSDVNMSHPDVGSRQLQRQVREACRRGDMPGAFKVNTLWHFPRASFEAWQQRHRLEPRRSAANDVEPTPAPSPARPAPTSAQTAREQRRARLGLAGGTR